MQCIAVGHVRVLLIYRLERILRSISEWTRLQGFLAEHGCRLLSPTEDHSDASASGRLKTNMMMSFAEYERANVAEKTRSKMLAQARRGMWGGGYIPFGYSYDREKQELHPNTEEAPIVQRIFQRAAELHSVYDIARDLNSEGFRTGVRWMRNPNRELQPIGHKPFRAETLLKWIANPLYRGAVRFGGNEFKGRHKALVSAETWDNANAAVAEAKRFRQPRLRNQDKYANMLKGLAYCAAGGTFLYSGASGKPGTGEKRYRYYSCSRRRGPDHNCLLGSIAAGPLEATVVAFLSRMGTEAGVLDLLCGTSASLPVTRKRIEIQLAEVIKGLAEKDQQIANCLDVIATKGVEAITDELMQKIAAIRASKRAGLVLRTQLQQRILAFDASRLDRDRVHRAAERLGRLLPTLESSKQAVLVRNLIKRVNVDACANNRSRVERGRSIILTLQLRVDRVVEAMERDVIIEASEPATSHAGQTVEFELHTIFGAKGRVELVAPFSMSIGDAARPPDLDKSSRDDVKHPIHRATRWQTQLPGASVRSIASMERVSPSLVSLHLKLLRLAPEIQIFVRELATPRAVHHFSLRRLAALADLERDRQLIEFASLRKNFS